MLYLESFVHRVRLAEIVSRWMVNAPEPQDVQQLKAIVNFNSYIARIWADRLVKQLLTNLHDQEPLSLVAKTKGQLKDFVVQHPPYTSARIEEMISRYRRFPEDFYRDTPLDGRIYYKPGGGSRLFVGATRIKRFRRIAEKGSRRIVDFMFDRIRANADALAEERAMRLGIPKDQLITSPDEMIEEFRHAERRLVKSIKQGTIQSELPILSIPDVVGIKLIAERDQYERLLGVLAATSSCQVLEEERHSGHYNAINLRVAHMIPKDLLGSLPPAGDALKVMARRGFDPSRVQADYAAFLTDAEDHILLEIIVADFQEFLESEIGRSMHEERVLEQRANSEYRSHLATNIRYLMDFILGLCLAENEDGLMDVPIKLWVRYMPDTIDRLLRGLYRAPADSSFDLPVEESVPQEPQEPVVERLVAGQVPN